MALSLSRFGSCLSSLVVCLASASLAAQGDGSFRDVTVVASGQRPGASARSLEGDERSDVVGREHGALAAQAEIFSRQVEALRLRLEALGVSGAGSPESLVEQRLVTAVSDLRQSEVQSRALRVALESILEALGVYLPVLQMSDAEAALVLRSRMNTAQLALNPVSSGAPVSVGSELAPGSVVVSVIQNLGVVLVSPGTDSQVRLGTPFLIERGGRVVGRARAVDVRARVCALVVESTVDGGVSGLGIIEGDSVRLDARR
jgi:hypothetical protein